MLNQLVESKNHREENTRRRGFVLTISGLLVAVLASGWTYSLFAKNLGLGAGELELSSLVAPVAAPEEAPPPPKPEVRVERTNAAPTAGKIVLRELYDDLSADREPPKDVRGAREVVSARQFDLTDVERGDRNLIPSENGRTTGAPTGGCGLCGPAGGVKNRPDEEETAPVVVKSTPKAPEPKKERPVVSGGVVNGRAENLVTPPYPPAARVVRASGAVNVQVLIDEQGRVVSATAVSGHPLLRAAAVDAARRSRFTPTKLSGEPVKVTGVIVYNFQQP